jgi:two-component system chemotaxis response regulator CheB
MADDGRQSGRRAVAEMYDARAEEYRQCAEIIRAAVLKSLEEMAMQPEPDD